LQANYVIIRTKRKNTKHSHLVVQTN